MHNEYESPAQLKDERDYWKNRFVEYRKDVEFFVTITLAIVLTICVELIIKNISKAPY